MYLYIPRSPVPVDKKERKLVKFVMSCIPLQYCNQWSAKKVHCVSEMSYLTAILQKPLQNQTFISQFTQIKLIWLSSYSLKIKLRAFPDIILKIWFQQLSFTKSTGGVSCLTNTKWFFFDKSLLLNLTLALVKKETILFVQNAITTALPKKTVILSHSMCSSKQCDMHFLLQILEICNFVVGGEMTDRILLLLRVLGVLSLCRSCWVRDLLLPEHTFCHPHPIPHFHPHPHLQPHPHCLKSENKTYFFMPGINPDTCPITPPAIL